MIKIWDSFMMRDELDILRLRLEELEGKVHKHILVESERDFHGRPKPLYYAENQEDFAQWHDQIVHIIVSSPENLPFDPFTREHEQRDHARAYLEQYAEPDNLVLLCDIDEIPSDKALSWRGSGAVALKMKTTHSAVDWVYPQPEYASVIARMGFIRGYTLGDIRDGRYQYEVIEDGGWHLSWLGGVEKQREKLTVTYHLELPADELDAINSGRSYTHGEHLSGKLMMKPVDVNEQWPRMIYERRCPPSWFRPRENNDV